MERRKFTREFKLEAVKLIQERGVTAAQAARDLGVQGSVSRRWVQECAADSQQAFPGLGQMKPEQAELARLRREVIKLTAERDILKKAAAYFAQEAPHSAVNMQSPVEFSAAWFVKDKTRAVHS